MYRLHIKCTSLPVIFINTVKKYEYVLMLFLKLHIDIILLLFENKIRMFVNKWLKGDSTDKKLKNRFALWPNHLMIKFKSRVPPFWLPDAAFILYRRLDEGITALPFIPRRVLEEAFMTPKKLLPEEKLQLYRQLTKIVAPWNNNDHVFNAPAPVPMVVLGVNLVSTGL